MPYAPGRFEIRGDRAQLLPWVLTVFVATATLACGTAPAPAPVPVSSTSPPVGVAPSPEPEVQAASEAQPDPMWQAILERRIFSRVGPPGAPRCVELALEPEAPAGGYTGDVVFDEPALRLRYEGVEPSLTNPRVASEGIAVPIPCEEQGPSAWFLERARCLDPEARADIEPKGCVVGDPAGIDAVVSGAHRASLLQRLRSQFSVWLAAPTCLEHVVQESKGSSFPREQQSHALTLYPRGFGYPSVLAEEGKATLVVQEIAQKNPYQPKRKPGSGGIALGCCSDAERFHVVDLGEASVTLVRNPPRNPTKWARPGGDQVTWYFSADACARAKALR